jgi:hypothetical protein
MRFRSSFPLAQSVTAEKDLFVIWFSPKKPRFSHHFEPGEQQILDNEAPIADNTSLLK